MGQTVVVGSRIPNVPLAQVSDGRIVTVEADQLFREGRSIVLGIPGAFTPVCTRQHIPDFVAGADAFRKSGYRNVVCIATNDPFVVDAWRRTVDPEGAIGFYSDGNLEFCAALGLVSASTGFFMGRRSQRYLLVVQDMVVQRFRVEASIESYTCTRTADVAA